MGLDLSHIANKYKTAEGKVSAAPASDVGDFERGLRQSSAGLMLTGELPPAPPANPELIDVLQEGAGQLVGDLPLSILGGIIGGAVGAPGGPTAAVTGAAGAFALPELVSETLRQAYAKGEIVSFNDFLERAKAVMAETAKSGAVGAATGGVGRLTKAILPATAKIAQKTLPVVSEIATAGTLLPLVEGETPTPKDYIAQAAPVVGVKLAGKFASKLREAHQASGTTVSDTAKRIKDFVDAAKAEGRNVTPEQAADEIIRAGKKNNSTDAIVDEAGARVELTAQPQGVDLSSVASKKRESSAPPVVDPKFAREEVRKILAESEQSTSRRPATPPKEQLAQNSVGSRIVNDINDKLPGSDTTTQEAPRRRADKLWYLTRKWLSPERAALERSRRREGVVVDELSPKGQDVSSRIIGGELYFHQRMADAATTFHDAAKHLDKEDKLLVRPLMELIYKGGDLAERAKAAHPEAYNAAETIVKWFDSAKADIKAYYRTRLQRNLTPLQRRAFTEMISASNAYERGSILTRYAMDEKSRRRLNAIVGKYAGIDKWGLPEYITNVELGAYRLRDNKGNTRAFAQTRKGLMEKYKALVAEDPAAFSGAEFKDLMSTEFGKSINPLILRKKKVNLKGEQDIFDALNAYASSVYKRIILEPIDFEMRKAFRERPGDFPQELRGLLSQQLRDAHGRYSMGEKIFDQMAIGLGKRTGGYSRALSNVKAQTARLALGYRPAAWITNVIGGYGKVWVKHGVGQMMRAKQFMSTEAGKRFLSQEEKIGSLGVNVFIGEGGKVHTTLKPYDPLWLFSKPEPGIRKLNLTAAYLDGISKGMSEPAAREYARRMLRMTNFTYNVSALPEIMRSNEARLIGQFKTYLVKELEFMHTLSPKEWAKYVTFNMLTGGPRVALQMARTIPILGALGLLDELDLGLEESLGDWYRGLPGKAAGIDLSSSVALQLPDNPGDVMGLFLSHMVKLYKDVLYPAVKGEKYVSDKFVDWGADLSPLLRHWEELWDVTRNDGWVLNRRGERTYRVTSDWDKAMLAAGFSTADLSKSRAVERVVDRQLEKSQNNKRAIMRRILTNMNHADDIDRAIRTKLVSLKGEIPEGLWGELYGIWATEGKIPSDLKRDIVDYGLTPEAIRKAVIASKLDAKNRLIRRMSLRDRIQALETFEGVQ